MSRRDRVEGPHSMAVRNKPAVVRSAEGRTVPRLQVWRRKIRPTILRSAIKNAGSLRWTPPLLEALLDELHVDDGFEAHLGRPLSTLPVARYPQATMQALLGRQPACAAAASRWTYLIGATARTTEAVRRFHGAGDGSDRGRPSPIHPTSTSRNALLGTRSERVENTVDCLHIQS
jgi:hypothetical protein